MMATNAEFKQRSYGPIDVSADEIGSFNTGINVDAITDVAHPMFVSKVLIPGSAQVLFKGDAKVDVQRIVHAGIEMHFHKPIRPGDALSCRSHLLSLDEKPSGKLVNIAVSIEDAAGDTVVDGITRYFSRGGGSSGKKGEPEPWLNGDLSMDVEVPTKDDQSLLYAVGSGDAFPIHTDDNFAKMVGLPGVIMHGMCTLALSVNAVTNALLDGDDARVASVSTRFAKIVLPGQVLRVTATRDGDGIRFETHKPDGKLALSEGRITVR